MNLNRGEEMKQKTNYELFSSIMELNKALVEQSLTQALQIADIDKRILVNEYKVIRCAGSRQCGKTTWIINNATPNSLIITVNSHNEKEYINKVPNALVMTIFNFYDEFIVKNKELNFSNIYIDNASHIPGAAIHACQALIKQDKLNTLIFALG